MLQFSTVSQKNMVLKDCTNQAEPKTAYERACQKHAQASDNLMARKLECKLAMEAKQVRAC